MDHAQSCYLTPIAQMINTKLLVTDSGSMSEFSGQASKISEGARTALEDLKNLGYDVEALGRRNMNDVQLQELRDKAFKYRGIEVPDSDGGMSALVNLFELGVDLSLKSPPTEARVLARHILYLAEKQLAEQ